MLNEDYFKDDKNKTGYLLNPKNIKLNRVWFKQMCQMLGVTALYRVPLPGQGKYNFYGELDAHYYPAKIVQVI